MVSEYSERNLRGRKRLGCSPLLVFWFFFFFWMEKEKHMISVCDVWLFATPLTIAHQTPLTMGFSRQEYWSGLPCPPPGDLPNPGTKPRSPTLQADSLLTESSGKTTWFLSTCKNEIRVDETHSNNVVTYLHLSKLIKFFLFLTLKNKRHSHV